MWSWAIGTSLAKFKPAYCHGNALQNGIHWPAICGHELLHFKPAYKW